MHEAARAGSGLRADGFHGIFDKLRQLEIVDDLADDLYAASESNFWHDYCGDCDDDLPHLAREIDRPGLRVLDLACGSGRIALALARAGATVDGLELSPAMLALARRALAEEAPEVAQRLRFIAGDMADFALDRQYDRIVLGATSLCLLLEPAQRAALFRAVRRHLAPHGRFVFNLLHHAGPDGTAGDGGDAAPAEFTDVYSRSCAEGQDFAIVGQRRDPASGHYLFNVYRERIAWTGETRRSLAASVKAHLDEAALRAQIAAAGLQLSARWSDGAVRYLRVEHAHFDGGSQ